MCQKRLISRSFIVLSVGGFLSYLLLHASFLLAEYYPTSVWSEVMEYVRHYLTRAWEFLFPVAMGAICFLLYRRGGALRALLGCLILSVSRLFYSLFYYYIYFLTLGFHTEDAIPLSILASLAMVLLTAIQVCCLMLIGHIAARIYKRKYDERSEAGERRAFAFGCAGGEFALFFIYEVIDTVEFIIEYGLDFKPSEIIVMCFNYIFILALAVASYFISAKLSERIIEEQG